MCIFNEYDIDLEEDILTIDETDINSKLVIYNDDYNSFQHVITCLMKYCDHTMEQAEQSAFIIHTKGKYAVKQGLFDDLKPMREALNEKGIDAKIEK